MDIPNINTLKINKTSAGRKVKYNTEFTIIGRLEKIINYLKTDINFNIIKVISVINDIEKNTIVRVMTCPLPKTKVVDAIIGTNKLFVEYDIAYNESMIFIKAINPESINKFFKFTEELQIIQEGDKLVFIRNSKIFNFGKQIPIFGNDYQEYDDYFNYHTLSFYLELARISSFD